MSRPSGRAAAYYRPFVVNPEATLEQLLQEWIDLRPGDAVLDSTERGFPSDPNNPHTDQGDRHHGIYLFDGTALQAIGELNDEFWENEAFDVANFTPRYWERILNNATQVRFDVRKNLGVIDPQYISVLSRADGQGSHLVYPYIGRDGKKYGIVDADVKDPTPERIKEFIREIQDQNLFMYEADDDIDTGSPYERIPLPSDVSQDQFLYHHKPT